jgi:predicted Zn-dependent protease/predicted RNA-binding Zn-ribbon protein involved in translation (DUF1610 family)
MAMSPVRGFFKRLFTKERSPEPGSLVEELWVADFRDEKSSRFLERDEGRYAASRHEGSLRLDLKKRDLFAWTEASLYRETDFVIEGELAFDPAAPHSAAGFLVRAANETNFYVILVTNRGYVRMDAVFNGKPRPVVAWTECPAPLGPSFSLRVIAHGSRFIVLIDDEWAFEAEDETFSSGHVAFAAQNYSEGEEASFFLNSCFVESRRVEVEAWFYRYNFYEIAAPEARARLATTFFAMGEWLDAAVQLKKIEKRRPLVAEELFLKAEVAIRLELWDEAEAAIDACLALAPEKDEAVEEKANLLYLRGRYPELSEYTGRLVEAKPDSARLWTLAGHARFNLGDYIGAAEDYGRAAAIEPGQPLFHMNEARAREQAGDRRGAAAAYLAAARGFFEDEADDDLSLALGRLEELDPRNPELAATKAKVLFRQGKKREARTAIEGLIAAGSRDSALYYLSGLIEVDAGRREAALGRFSRAAELEPTYPLYAFRLAETLFLLGRPEAKEAIGRALELAPEDGWTCNLAGEALLAGLSAELAAGPSGDLAATEAKGLSQGAAEARRLLEQAVMSLPGAPEPVVNLAELESLLGNADKALAALTAFPDDSGARNEAGNILARAGRVEEAAREYEKACYIEPGNAEYEANLAAAYFDQERYSDAEERIKKSLDLEASPRAYLIVGNLAAVYGDWPRAETAYRVGLEAAPKNADLLFAMGRNYVGARKLAKAEDCRDRLMAIDPGKAKRLDDEIAETMTESLSCASCGRVWRVPRDLPAQSGANIRAMPPDDSPAGACPRCGKIFCIACRKDSLVDNRFTCPDCGETLKLQDNRLRYLVRELLKREQGPL